MFKENSRAFESSYPTMFQILRAGASADEKDVQLLAEIDFRVFFNELKNMEKQIAKSILQNERDEKIYSYYEILQLLVRLNQIEVTQEEYDYLLESLEHFDTYSFAEFITKQTKKTMILSRQWERNVKQPLLFYELAQARDSAIAEAMDRFESSAEQKAVLVFGGFHKNAVLRILKERNMSYHVVSPRMTQVSERHQRYYKQLMSLGYHDFEISNQLRKAAVTLRALRMRRHRFHAYLRDNQAELPQDVQPYVGQMSRQPVAKSEARWVQDELRIKLSLSKKKVRDDLKSKKINWKLGEYHESLRKTHGTLVPVLNSSLGGLVGFAEAMGILEDFEEIVVQRYQEHAGVLSETSLSLGLKQETLMRKLLPKMDLSFDDVEIPEGVLLKKFKKQNEKPSQAKQRLLKSMKKPGPRQKAWDLKRLRREVGKKIPFVKHQGFPYAKLLWTLGLTQDFVEAYEEQFRYSYGQPTMVGEYFGFDRGSAKVRLEELLKGVVKHRGYPLDEISLDVRELLELDGPDALKRKLDSDEIRWSIPKFIEHYGETHPWMKGKGYFELIQDLGYESEYAAKLREMYIAFSGSLVALESYFQTDRRVLKRLSKKIGFDWDYPDVEIPAGNLLTTFYPEKDPEKAKEDLYERLKVANWRTLADLKEELMGDHPYFLLDSLSWGWLLWGLDLHEEFLEAYQARVKDHRGNPHQLGASFGWPMGTAKENFEKLIGEVSEEESERLANGFYEGERLEKGMLLTRLGKTREEVIRLLKSDEIDWDLAIFYEQYKERLHFFEYPDWEPYWGLLWGFDIIDEYKEVYLERYHANHGIYENAASDLGMSTETFKNLAVHLGIDLEELTIEEGSLLPLYAKKGETTEQTKDRVVRSLGKQWDIFQLKKRMAKKVPAVAYNNFSYARLIWGLGLTDEFLELYEERAKAHGGVEIWIGRSFGWKNNSKKTLNATLKGLEEFQGKRARQDVDILEVLGLTPTQLREDMDKKYKWDLPKFIVRNKRKLPYLTTQSYATIIRALDLTAEFRELVIVRYQQYHGGATLAGRSLGMTKKRFLGLARDLHINLAELEIVPGTYLKFASRKKTDEKAKKDVMTLWESVNWSLPRLKKKLSEKDSIFWGRNLPFANMVIGLDIEKEFFERLEALKEIHGEDWVAIGNGFGFRPHIAAVNIRVILAKLLPRRQKIVDAVEINEQSLDLFIQAGKALPVQKDPFVAYLFYRLRVAFETRQTEEIYDVLQRLQSRRGVFSEVMNQDVIEGFHHIYGQSISDEALRDKILLALRELELRFEVIPTIEVADKEDWKEQTSRHLNTTVDAIRYTFGASQEESIVRFAKVHEEFSKLQALTKKLSDAGQKRAQKELWDRLQGLLTFARQGNRQGFELAANGGFDGASISMRVAVEDLGRSFQKKKKKRSEVRMLFSNNLLNLPDFKVKVPTKAPPEKLAVVFDMKVFDSLTELKRSEWNREDVIRQKDEVYRMIRAYPEVKFVFMMNGERQLNLPLKILMELQSFGNVEIRTDPRDVSVYGYHVLSVSAEDVETDYTQRVESVAEKTNEGVSRMLYRADDESPGLMTAALRLLYDYGRKDLFTEERPFSEVPDFWVEDVLDYIASYIYIQASA